MTSLHNPWNNSTILDAALSSTGGGDTFEDFLQCLNVDLPGDLNLDDFEFLGEALTDDDGGIATQQWSQIPYPLLTQSSTSSGANSDSVGIRPTKRIARNGKAIIAQKANRNAKIAHFKSGEKLVIIRRNNNGRKCAYRINGKKLMLPSLVKNDIRLSYAKMFANVFNSHDESLISDFLQTRCVKSCSMVNKCAFAPEFNLPERLEVEGQQLIFEFWHGRLVQFPDTVFEIEDAKVRSKYKPITMENLGSTIEATVRVSGTRLYQLRREDWLPSLVQYEQERERQQRLRKIQIDRHMEKVNSMKSISSADTTAGEVHSSNSNNSSSNNNNNSSSRLTSIDTSSNHSYSPEQQQQQQLRVQSSKKRSYSEDDCEEDYGSVSHTTIATISSKSMSRGEEAYCCSTDSLESSDDEGRVYSPCNATTTTATAQSTVLSATAGCPAPAVNPYLSALLGGDLNTAFMASSSSNSSSMIAAMPRSERAQGCALIDFATILNPKPMHMRSKMRIMVDSNMAITGFEFDSKPIPVEPQQQQQPRT